MTSTLGLWGFSAFVRGVIRMTELHMVVWVPVRHVLLSGLLRHVLWYCDAEQSYCCCSATCCVGCRHVNIQLHNVHNIQLHNVGEFRQMQV